MALSGDWALVGAPRNSRGSAYVFVRSGTSWAQLQPKITANDFQFGLSVALNEDTALVGAINDAYVYPRFPRWQLQHVRRRLSGTLGVPSLAAAPSQVPWIGTTFEIRLSGMPTAITNTPFGVLGLSKTNWDEFSLPLDLSQFGIRNCTAYVSADFAAPLVNEGGTATWEIPIPNNPFLIGLPIYLQGAVFDFEATLPTSL